MQSLILTNCEYRSEDGWWTNSQGRRNSNMTKSIAGGFWFHTIIFFLPKQFAMGDAHQLEFVPQELAEPMHHHGKTRLLQCQNFLSPLPACSMHVCITSFQFIAFLAKISTKGVHTWLWLRSYSLSQECSCGTNISVTWQDRAAFFP